MYLDLPAPIYRLYLYVDYILGTIRRAAMLDPALAGLIDSRQGLDPLVMLGVVLAAAASLVAARALPLLLARTPARAMGRPLVNEGLRVLAGYLGAAVGLWVCSRLVLGAGPNLWRSLQFAALSYAPLALGALAATPRAGRLILAALYGWAAIVVVTLLHRVFDTGYLAALVCAAAMLPGRYAAIAAFNWLISPPADDPLRRHAPAQGHRA